MIVTLGADGSRIHADGRTLTIPAVPPAALVDPTGCGDAYRAGLLYGIAHGWDWDEDGAARGAHGRAQDRASRRTEPHRRPRRDRRALPRAVRRLSLVSRTRWRSPPRRIAAAVPLARTARAWALHVVEGVATTLLVFPSSDLHAQAARSRRWSRAPAADAAHRGAHPRRSRRRPARQPADRRQPHLVARHLRARTRCSRRASSPRPSSGAGPWSAGSSPTSARCSSSASGGAHTHTVNRDAAAALARGDVVAIFPEGTTTDGTTLLPFTARCCSRSSTPRATCSRSRSATAMPDGAHSDAPAYVGETSFVASFWRVTGGARARRRSARRAGAARAGAPPARARARRRRRYPNGFGVTGARLGT